MPITNLAVAPKVFKNYKLVIPGASTGGTDFAAHVSAVTLQPTASTQTWKGAAPGASFSDVTEATWAALLAYAQDWTTPGSLSLFLLEHEGETFPNVEFWPLGDGPKFTLDGLILAAGEIGGAIDAYGTAQVTCGVVGKPKFTAGSTPAP